MFEVVMPGDRTYKFRKDRSTEVYVCFLNGPPREEECDSDSLPPLVDDSDVEFDDDDHTDRDLSAAEVSFANLVTTDALKPTTSLLA